LDAGDFLVEPVQDELGLAQGAFGAYGALVFLGQALGAFTIGFLGGDAPLFTGQIPETCGPIS
jgi:hypothetical protein